MKTDPIYRTYSTPFGMLVQERVYAATVYRFDFNGKEKDDEISGSGNQYDYGFRIYNSRLGKFFSVDPLFKEYPYLTTYQFAHNRPISCIDLDGLEGRLNIDAAIISNNGMPTLHAATGEVLQVTFVYVVENGLSIKSNAKAMSSAFRELKSGKLYGTDGKEYSTKRIAEYDAIVSDGIQYKNVVKGTNFGYKIEGEIITTTGIDQLKVFKSKSIWSAFSNLAKMAWIIDIADMAVAYSEGDVSQSMPLSFVGNSMQEEGEDMVKQAIHRQMIKSIDEGLDATKKFVKGEQFQNLEGFQLMEVDLETMNKIYSGEINNYDQLFLATMKYNPNTKFEYSILLESGKGTSTIKAVFKNDFKIEKSQE